MQVPIAQEIKVLGQWLPGAITVADLISQLQALPQDLQLIDTDDRTVNGYQVVVIDPDGMDRQVCLKIMADRHGA